MRGQTPTWGSDDGCKHAQNTNGLTEEHAALHRSDSSGVCCISSVVPGWCWCVHVQQQPAVHVSTLLRGVCVRACVFSPLFSCTPLLCQAPDLPLCLLSHRSSPAFSSLPSSLALPSSAASSPLTDPPLCFHSQRVLSAFSSLSVCLPFVSCVRAAPSPPHSFAVTSVFHLLLAPLLHLSS